MDLFKRFMLPISMVFLGFGFWAYPNFEKIAAGIAVFLFGLWMLKRGVQTLSGGLIEDTLQKVTRSTPHSIGFGFVSTTLVQSSTLVMVLAISFLAAGIIPLSTGLGVVMGANLGTTTGTWLVASFGLSMSLAKIALPLLVFGVLLLFQTRSAYSAVGHLLLGMGFLFLGIDYIKEGFQVLQSSLDLNQYNPDGFLDVLVVFVIGFIMTIVMQSSHASLLLTLSALSVGQISFTMAAAITVGACVGTTITPLVGSLGTNAAGRRLALTHVLFNLITAIVVLPLLPVALFAIEHLSVWTGITDPNSPLKLAYFHTGFSIAGVCIIYPLRGRLEKALQTLIPDEEATGSKAQFLSSVALESTATAIAVTRSETIHLYELSTGIIINGVGWQSHEFHQDKPLTQLSELNKNAIADIQQGYEQHIKGIYSDIIGFISSARENSSDIQDELLRDLWTANFHLIDAIKGVKHLQKNLQAYVSHPNQYIAHAYQDIRLQLGEALRAVEFAKNTKDPIESRLALDHQQLIIERIREESNALIENFIRQRQVTTQMATSLMTDKGYVNQASLNLLTVGRILFIEKDKPQTQSPDSFDLEDEELTAINQKLYEQRLEASVEENQ